MYLLVSLLSTASALACYNYTSAVQKSNVCATRSNETIALSVSPCQDGQYCSVQEMLGYFADHDTEDAYGCQKFTQAVNRTSVPDKCSSRHKDADLKQGSYPKKCTDSSDCLLVNGNSTACECGLNGTAYCHPDFSSSVFELYWEDCSLNNGTVGDSDLAAYMYYLDEVYPYTISPSKYASSLFTELITLKGLADKAKVDNSTDTTDDESDAASTLMIGSLVWMVVS
jgi:hypothetical protein